MVTSVAGLLTCLPLSQLSVVDVQPNYIFAALFDMHGTKHSAHFCTSRVLEVSHNFGLLSSTHLEAAHAYPADFVMLVSMWSI